MRVWIKKHIGLLIVGIVISLFLECSAIVLFFGNYPQMHRTLWEQSKPEKYYMKISYYHECTRTWEGIWENDKLLNIVSDQISEGDACWEEGLEITEWSMDYIFDEIVKNCGKGTVACTVQYDPRFHYPKEATSLYQYIFKAKVVACDIGKSSCP